MDVEERDNKLFELSELHKLWLQLDPKNPQEQTDIFMVSLFGWHTIH